MDIRLSFFGAAQTVTGSRYILEANGMRILIDCGMYQERDYRYRNWAPYHRDPASIDAMLLTHAHLDHSGLIPRMVSQGFSGPIHCTAATAKIATIIMADSAKIMAEDVAFKKRRHERAGRKSPHSYDPLYNREDVEKAVRLFKHAGMDTPIDLGGGITATFCEAGHILGSTHILITVKQGDEERTILFSGDIGRWGANYLFFFGGEILGDLKQRKRRAKHVAVTRAVEDAALHTCSVCGATEASDPGRDFRYDDAGTCFCDEHLGA